MTYLIFAAAIVAVNLLPAFAPPTWTLIVFFLNYYHLNIFLVILIAVFSAALGRFFLYTYIQKFSHIVFNDWEKENLEYLGKRLGSNLKTNFVFIFIYSITPLSTTALFVASAMAKINRLILMAGFICGRLISYSFLAFTSQIIVKEVDELTKGIFSWQSIVATLLGLGALLFFSFLDWREVLENKKFKLNFRIWRWNS